MYLSQTNLEVDTTKKFNFIASYDPPITVEVYKTKPGAYNPAVHRRNPSYQIIEVEAFERVGRDAVILELTPTRKKRLTKI